MRHAVCSIVMQRVVSMMHVSKEDQQAAYAYAEAKTLEGTADVPLFLDTGSTTA